MNEIFVVTLWPPSLKLANDIEVEISKQYSIISSNEYKMGKEEFRKFIFRMYKPDKTPASRLKRKYKAMRAHGTGVRILELSVPSPTMLPHKKTRLKGTFYCKEMKKLKREMRSTFKHRVSGYIHDIVIHISDNEGHNNRTRKLIKKYAKSII